MAYFRIIIALMLGGLGAAALAQAPASAPTVVRRVYDVGDVVAKPRAVGAVQPDAAADPAERVVRALLEALAGPVGSALTIEILNGTQLAIETSPSTHVQIAELIASFRRRADVAVFVRADLYEVDADFHAKLANAKRVSIEEQERIFLSGKLPKGESLFDRLANAKPVLAGPERRADDGTSTALLSWRRVVRTGILPRQTAFTGVAFRADIHVSGDRRYVHAKLTEQMADLDALHKVKTWNGTRKDWVDTDEPLLKEATFTRVLTVPDGGAVLVPVHARPASAQDGRRWVLSVRARISIAEEEKAKQP